MRRGLASVMVVLAMGCGPTAGPEAEAEAEAESEGEGEGEGEAESEGEGDAESEGGAASGAAPADGLAREVWRAAGGESLPQVGQLDFRFVVQDAGETVFEAAHRWDRRAGRDRVTWADRQGVLHDAIVWLGDRRACGHLDGEPAEGEALAALAEAAYARWVNDAYWLMVPLKVLDPGVQRRVVGEGDPRRLELTFAGVGLTPGDRYVLDIDAAGRLTRWEMSLEGAEPPPTGVTFEGHQSVGPLTLPLDHTDEGGERRVLLRDVEVHEAVRREDFVVRGCADGDSAASAPSAG